MTYWTCVCGERFKQEDMALVEAPIGYSYNIMLIDDTTLKYICPDCIIVWALLKKGYPNPETNMFTFFNKP